MRHRQRQLFQCAIESLEFRRLFSSSPFTTIAFNGADGYAPVQAAEDASGNVFGITSFTQNGSTTGNGVVFEVAAGTSKIVDLATLPNVAGQQFDQGQSLILDSVGDIFGTDQNAIFEIAKGTHTLVIRATFPSSPSQGKVEAADANGDVFGVGDDGDLFELAKGSSTITPNVFGSGQIAGSLVTGPDGNLYGLGSDGLVEISLQTNAVTPLASFQSADIGTGPYSFTFDSSGNIWGLSEYGGPNGSSPGNGTIWEYDKSTQTLVERAAFTSATGYTPLTSPVINTSTGVLYGVTEQGGANNDGTLFSFDTSSFDTTETPAAVTRASAPSIQVQGNFSDSNAPTSGTQMVQPSRGDPLAPTEVLLQNTTVSPFGALLVLTAPKPVITVPTSKLWKSDGSDVKASQEAEANQAKAAAEAAAPVGPSPASTRAFNPLTLSIEATRSEQIAAIKSLLSKATKDITMAEGEITKGISILNAYTSLGTDITSLDKQLAATTKTATKDKLQKEIDTDQTDQNADATEDNSYYSKVGSELTTISGLLSESKADLNDLPKATVSFAGGVVTVPAVLARGKKGTAVVSITNDGDVTAAGTLTISLLARPRGTTGAADVSLPLSPVTISLAAGATANQSLTFKVPKTLANGHYSLVVEIDPKSLYKEASANAPIVSSQIFRVD